MYCAVSGLCIVMALLFVQKSSLIIIIRAPQSSVTCYTDSASSQRTNITAWWGHCTRGTWHNHTSLQSHFCFLNPVDIHGAYEHYPVSSHVGLYLDAFAWICQLFKTLHCRCTIKHKCFIHYGIPLCLCITASFIYTTFSITTDFCSKLVCIWSSLYLVNRNVYGSSHYHGTNCSDISQKYAIWYFCLKFPISEGRGKYIFQ